jgi:hypothetical protein
MSLHPTFDLVIPVFGNLVIALTEANHAHVSGPITVRGIQYNISVHLYQHSDGRFRTGLEGATPFDVYRQLYVTRNGDLTGRAVSDAARKTIQEQVELAANNFIVNNPSVLVEAERLHLFREMASAQSEYREAMDAADKLRKVRDEKQEAYENFLRKVSK